MTTDERKRFNKRRLRTTTETTVRTHIHHLDIIPGIREPPALGIPYPHREKLCKPDPSVEAGLLRHIPSQLLWPEFRNGSHTLLWHEKVLLEVGLANLRRVPLPMAPSQRKASTNVTTVINV
jgi:hypothetical protein